MDVFISSLISGMEEDRAAVRRATERLGHRAMMAEDFGARPNSPARGRSSASPKPKWPWPGTT